MNGDDHRLLLGQGAGFVKDQRIDAAQLLQRAAIFDQNPLFRCHHQIVQKTQPTQHIEMAHGVGVHHSGGSTKP